MAFSAHADKPIFGVNLRVVRVVEVGGTASAVQIGSSSSDSRPSSAARQAAQRSTE